MLALVSTSRASFVLEAGSIRVQLHSSAHENDKNQRQQGQDKQRVIREDTSNTQKTHATAKFEANLSLHAMRS